MAQHITEAQLKNANRRRVFAIMFQLGFINEKMTTEEKTAIINSWIKEKTKNNGELNDLNLSQLASLINQLQAVLRRTNEKYVLPSLN